MRKRRGERAIDIAIGVILVVIGAVSIYPIWYVLIASISDPAAIATGKVLLLPKGFNLAAYRKLYEMPQVWVGYRNSILYTTASCLLDLTVMMTCGFALAQKGIPGRKYVSTLFIFTMYFSGGMVPRFLVVNALGMLDSPLALIIPGCVNVYNLILIRNFFENSLPESLLDAARVDGSSFTQYFLRIAMPLSKSITAIIALFSITGHWNAYMGAQLYLYTPKLFTLQQVIKNIMAVTSSTLSDERLSAQEISKIALEVSLQKYSLVVVACLPLVIAYPFVQRYFVQGVMLGSVKG